MIKWFLFGLLVAIVIMSLESLWPVLIGLLILGLLVLCLAAYFVLGVSGAGTGETPMEVLKRFAREALGL